MPFITLLIICNAENDVDSHLLRKSLKKSRQAKNGVEKKEVKGGEQENESKSTKVNLHLTLRQMILNLPKKGEKERSQQDLQRTFSYQLNWQLLLVLVRLLDTRLWSNCGHILRKIICKIQKINNLPFAMINLWKWLEKKSSNVSEWQNIWKIICPKSTQFAKNALVYFTIFNSSADVNVWIYSYYMSILSPWI